MHASGSTDNLHRRDTIIFACSLQVNAVGDASGMAPLPLLVRPTSASTLPKERPPSAGLSESATVMNSGKLEAQVGEKEVRH